MAVNIFMLGVAWQGGLIPISEPAIKEAIELNGVGAAKNLLVFQWGRKYYENAGEVEGLLTPIVGETGGVDYSQELRAYQGASYAREFEQFVAEVERRAPALKDAVAKHLYKLMAYKDEYEVARLLTRPEFENRVRGMWDAPESISYNLHPPFLRHFGVQRKLKLGPWFRTPLAALARMKALRGTPFDVFGMSRHRRMEHSLAGWYKDLIRRVMDFLNEDNEAQALEIALLPDQIRGYERIKEKSVDEVKRAAEQKLAALSGETLVQLTR
jgi:indolepyruvate ferredoxin oxidoreductase